MEIYEFENLSMCQKLNSTIKEKKYFKNGFPLTIFIFTSKKLYFISKVLDIIIYNNIIF